MNQSCEETKSLFFKRPIDNKCLFETKEWGKSPNGLGFIPQRYKVLSNEEFHAILKESEHRRETIHSATVEEATPSGSARERPRRATSATAAARLVNAIEAAVNQVESA